MTIVEFLKNLPDGIYTDESLISELQSEIDKGWKDSTSIYVYMDVSNITLETEPILIETMSDVNTSYINELIKKHLIDALEKEVCFGWGGDYDNVIIAHDTLRDAVDILENL